MPSASVTATEPGRSVARTSRAAVVEAAVAAAQARVSRHFHYLTGHEARTRIVVIDPVLHALQWPVDDPDRVVLEHRDNGNRPDYVLLDRNGERLAVVEAKRVDEPLRDRSRAQASGYAVSLGVQIAVLTNGLRWEAWRIVSGRSSRKTQIVEAHLGSDPVEAIARRLLPLHRGDLGVGAHHGMTPAPAKS